jgi:hypothetical protein
MAGEILGGFLDKMLGASARGGFDTVLLVTLLA